MCSCNKNNNFVKILIGAEIIKQIPRYLRIDFTDRFENYEYGGKLEHTQIPETRYNLYKKELKRTFKETNWDSEKDIKLLLFTINNFLTNQVPNLKFQNLVIPRPGICTRCWLPSAFALVDNILVNYSEFHHYLIFSQKHKKNIYNFEIILKNKSGFVYNIIHLKRKFNNFQKLKMLMIIKYNPLVSEKIFNYIGKLYSQRFDSSWDKYSIWMENQMNYLKNKYE